MRAVLVAVILGCLVAASFGKLDRSKFPPQTLENLNEWHNKCKRMTGTTEEDITAMINGRFPENIAIKRYTYCLWDIVFGIKKGFNIDIEKTWHYLPNMHKADYINYALCYKKAKDIPGDDWVEKIWQMQKCNQKRIDDAHYMFA
ncbi:uncharacterized protein [Diabrotica undecimpunctata]|uniref:uncharacterized protein n=1 Tax=Diabrotica undecimpunctata TaxID=50387 RepID=UPI003B6386A4